MVFENIGRLKHLNYENALLKLFNLNWEVPFKYNLDNVLALSNHFGNPHKSMKFIHVTGTNGKGSVTYKLSKIL